MHIMNQPVDVTLDGLVYTGFTGPDFKYEDEICEDLTGYFCLVPGLMEVVYEGDMKPF